MKNSSSERKTKTHKIARNWNFIKYKSIQISTNAFLNSSDVEVDKMGWITVISHSLLYMESHIRGITQSCTSPSQPPQPCCPSGWAGGSAGWDYVTVFAELSSCCYKYNNWCKASKLIAPPSTIKRRRIYWKVQQKISTKYFCVYINNLMCFWFLVWLQVVLNEIYQRKVELDINIKMLAPCQSALLLLRYFLSKVNILNC